MSSSDDNDQPSKIVHTRTVKKPPSMLQKRKSTAIVSSSSDSDSDLDSDSESFSSMKPPTKTSKQLETYDVLLEKESVAMKSEDWTVAVKLQTAMLEAIEREQLNKDVAFAVLERRGHACAHLKRYFDVMADAETIIDLSGSNLLFLLQGHTLGGIAHFSLNDYDSAIESFNSISSIAKDDTRWSDAERNDERILTLCTDAASRKHHCQTLIEENKAAVNARAESNRRKHSSASGNEDDMEDDLEGDGVVLNEYIPSVSAGKPHPTTVTLSANMEHASTHKIGESEIKVLLHADVMADANLSDVQLEAIAMATRANSKGLAFCNGDSTGMGKGRTAMGFFKNNHLNFGSTRCVYLTVNHTLPDVRRDYNDVEIAMCGRLTDIGDISKSTRVLKARNGLLYVPHSKLVIYSAKKIASWLIGNAETDASNTLVVDEVHRCNNIKTKVGQALAELLKLVAVHGTRIMFMSATFATSINDLQPIGKYLGLFENERFDDFKSFHSKFNRLGLAGVELVSAHLACDGTYTSRQLSLHGVSVETRHFDLSTEQMQLHTKCSAIFAGIAHLDVIRKASLYKIRLDFFQALDMIFRAVPVGDIVEECLQNGNSVVITTLKTGEATTKRAASKIFNAHKKARANALSRRHTEACADTSDSDDSDQPGGPDDAGEPGAAGSTTAEAVAPSAVSTDVASENSEGFTDGNASMSILSDIFEQLLSKAREGAQEKESFGMLRFIEKFEKQVKNITLPDVPSALDYLHNRFSGDESHVAELTGRSVMNVRDVNSGKWMPVRITNNITEQIRYFQKGTTPSKKVCRVSILSAVASTGTSLHHDSPHTGPRVMIALGLGWSPESVLQTYGRVHRSNQLSAPKIILLSSTQLAMARFTSIIEARMKVLGAITSSARDVKSALSTTAEQADFLSAAGNQAAFELAIDQRMDLGKQPESDSARKMLNHLLATPITKANVLFQQFEASVAEIKNYNKRMGKTDTGVTPLIKVDGAKVKLIDTKSTLEGGQLMTFEVDRGISWDDVCRLKCELISDGLKEKTFTFVRNRNPIPGSGHIIAASHPLPNGTCKVFRAYGVRGVMSKGECGDRYVPIDPSLAEAEWNHLYENSFSHCIHTTCKNAGLCKIGVRMKKVYVVTLPATEVIKHSHAPPALRRIQLADGQKMLGIEMSETEISRLM